MDEASGELPILKELADAGFVASSLADLRHSGTRYKAAVPVLLRWLGRDVDPSVKEEIVRALSVPWAKPVAVEPLAEQFRSIDGTVDPTGFGLRWVVGNALAAVFDDAHFDLFAELATNRPYGKARQMIVAALGKSRDPRAVTVIAGLIDDPDVDGHAVKALAKFNSPTARLALAGKVDDKRAWVRNEARKALAKFSA
ncbi:HEAT repeat domain-containing protein [Mesorhizobium japonicum]|uniref:HEAT repeat domain-containing protein n=1 Tax=Mesorhizobium japonicum TaxID=2066070 RepID=UPI003B5B04F2